jgi:hypothetical protein
MPNPPANSEDFNTLPYTLNPLPPAIRSKVCAVLPNLGAQSQRQLCLLIERAGYELLPQDASLFKPDFWPTFDVYKWDLWKKGLAYTTEGWQVFDKPTYTTLHNIFTSELPSREAACELMAENIAQFSSKANLDKLMHHIREHTRPEHKLILDAIDTDKIKDRKLLEHVQNAHRNFEKVKTSTARAQTLQEFVAVKKGMLKKTITVRIQDLGLWELLMFSLRAGELKEALGISWTELFDNMPAKHNNHTHGPLLRAAFQDGQDDLAERVFTHAAKYNVQLGYRLDLGAHLSQKPDLQKSLKIDVHNLTLPTIYLDLMDGKTVPKNEITGSTSWQKALSLLEEQRFEHKGQYILQTLAFLFSPEDAQSFINSAKPQDVLSLGPVWDILHIIAALKGHIS